MGPFEARQAARPAIANATSSSVIAIAIILGWAAKLVPPGPRMLPVVMAANAICNVPSMAVTVCLTGANK